MALLGEIRKRSWLLIVGITVPMVGFLLMDMTGPNGGSMFGNKNNVGKINGKSISIEDYQRRLQSRSNSNVDSYTQNQNVWDELVTENIINEESAAMGFDVKGDEIVELMSGTNLSPVVQQAFYNPQTRQVDAASAKQLYEQYRNRTAQPGVGTQMRSLEEQAIFTQKATKFSSLVGQALYTPKWLAESERANQTQTANVSYVQIPFSEATGAVNVTDEELGAYLKDNAWKYENKEETRTVKYVSFDVKATAKDSADMRAAMTKLKTEFAGASNDEEFVGNNYGTYDTRYVMRDEVDAKIADELFSAPAGTVVGPYLDNAGYYRITKLIDRKVVPDSVKSRHILRSTDINNPNSKIAARKTIDSLKVLLENRTANFDSLALYFGQDGTSARGGDLGYTGPVGFVKEFRDLVFYEAKKGDYNVVETQFGVHLVQVTGVKSTGKTGVRLATVGQYIAPSQDTQDDIYNKAVKFTRDNRSLEAMLASAVKEGLELKTAGSLKINDYENGDLKPSEDTRNLVRFAYESKPGTVSPEIYTYTEDAVEFYNSAYVVAALSSINEPGLPSVDAVREQIQQAVINNKKGAQLVSKIGNTTDLAGVTAIYPEARLTESSTISGQGMFNEPKVTAAIRGLQAGQTSKPVVGTGGVYVVQVLSKSDAAAGDISAVQTQVDRQIRQQMIQGGQLMEALRGASDVSDTRHIFY